MNQNGTPKVRASANLLKRFVGRFKAWRSAPEPAPPPVGLRDLTPDDLTLGELVLQVIVVAIVFGGMVGMVGMFKVSGDDLVIFQIMAAPLLIVIALCVLFYAALIVIALVASIPFWAWVIIVLLLVLIFR